MGNTISTRKNAVQRHAAWEKTRLRIQCRFGQGRCEATPYWVTMLHWLILIWEIKVPFSFIYSSSQCEQGESTDTNSASLMHIHSSAAHTANMTHQSRSFGDRLQAAHQELLEKSITPGHREDLHTAGNPSCSHREMCY